MPDWQRPNGTTWKRPPQWHRLRGHVLKRDNHQCQWPTTTGICGAPANQTDHIDRNGPRDNPDNMRALCEDHHKAKSSREGGQASAQARARTRAPQERHPGML